MLRISPQNCRQRNRCSNVIIQPWIFCCFGVKIWYKWKQWNRLSSISTMKAVSALVGHQKNPVMYMPWYSARTIPRSPFIVHIALRSPVLYCPLHCSLFNAGEFTFHGGLPPHLVSCTNTVPIVTSCDIHFSGVFRSSQFPSFGRKWKALHELLHTQKKKHRFFRRSSNTINDCCAVIKVIVKFELNAHLVFHYFTIALSNYEAQYSYYTYKRLKERHIWS